MQDEEPAQELVPEMDMNSEILQQIFDAKNGDPNKFQSFWEMDEEDIDEESMQEIQKNTAKKILWAAENNELDIVKELLRVDSTLVGSKDNDGYTPLHRASYNGHTDMVKFLIENGADIEAKTNDGWSPIHSACRWNQADVLSLLLQCGADINSQTGSQQTALHIASFDVECRQCLEILINNNDCNIFLTNNLGETAMTICRRISENYFLFEMKDKNINNLKQQT